MHVDYRGPLTAAASGDIDVNLARGNAGGEVLALGRSAQVDGTNALAILAAALRPDSKLSEGGLASRNVAAGSDLSGRAESSSEEGGESGDGELHLEDCGLKL